MDSLPVNVGASISKSTSQAPTVPNVPIPTMDTTPAAEKTEATIHRKILPKPPGIELIKTNSLSTLSDQELIKKLPKTSYYRMINLMKEKFKILDEISTEMSLLFSSENRKV